MTPTHQRLLESLHELEVLRESIVHANELSIRLANEEREFAMLDKMLIREQRDVDVLEKNGITRLIRKIIGDREERIDQEREEYDKVSNRHIELFKSIELIKFELEILKQKEDSLPCVEEKVALLLKEREKELESTNIIFAGTIKKLNEDISKQNEHHQKLKKLKTFGQSILTYVMRIENHLDEARVLWIGSKAGSTPLTYDKLDFARRLLPKTNQALLRFKKDLSGTYPDLHLDIRIILEKFGTYAQRPAFTSPEDLTMLQKIKSSQKSAHEIREQLEIVLTFLDQEQEEAKDRLSEIEEERRRVILSEE